MASFEIAGGGFAAQVKYDLTQDVGLNRSVMTITGVQMRSTTEGFVTQSCRVVGYININGATAVKMEYNNNASTGIIMSQSYSPVSGAVYKYSVTVNHQSDGSGPISISANLGVTAVSGGWDLGRLVQTKSMSLPRIPRVSTITAGSVELGQQMTINISRAASGFTDTVSWRCGSQSGTIAEQTASTTLSWTPPIALSSQAPEDTRVTVVLTVESYLNGTQVGSREAAVQCTIPASVVPTLAVTVEDRMGHLERYGGYVQDQSQVKVMTQAAGAYGSTIRKIQVSCGQLSGTGAEVSFSLGQSGSIAIRVTVTDSRGRTASSETTITVLPYQRPQATVLEAFRCDETGTPQPDGQWLKVVFDGSVTALTGNSAVYRGICTVHNGEDARTVLLSDYTNQQAVTRGSFLLTAGIDTAYDCQVTVQDDFQTVTGTAMLVSVAFALMDFNRSAKAVGIGMRARDANKLSIGLDTDMNEHSMGNMADPTEAQDAATKAYVDTQDAATKRYVDTKDAEATAMISDGWDSGKSYAEGDYCIHNNTLWLCLVANTNAEPTEGTYWTARTVASLLGNVRVKRITIQRGIPANSTVEFDLTAYFQPHETLLGVTLIISAYAIPYVTSAGKVETWVSYINKYGKKFTLTNISTEWQSHPIEITAMYGTN